MKQFINPNGLSKPGTYTHIVSAQGGKLVFVSGQVAQDANGTIVGPGDLRAQTKQAFENLEIALASAGASFADVVKLTTFVVNHKPENLKLLAEVRTEFFGSNPPPASTLLGVQALARPEYLIEIEAIAVVD